MKKGEKITILVIDDDPNMRRVIRQVLRCKYTLYQALNGVEAESFLQNNRIDLILLDCCFPLGQKSGLELLREFHQRFRGIPIITISAYRDNEFIKACRDRNIVFIEKPLDESVIEIIENHVRFNSGQTEHRLPAGESKTTEHRLPTSASNPKEHEHQTWSPQENPEAFSKNISQSGIYSKQWIYKFLENHIETEDILQESYLSIWKNNPVFSSYGEFLAYLQKTIKHKCLDWIRKNKKTLDFDQIWDDLEISIDPNGDIETTKEEILLSLINLLPEKDQRIIVSHYLKGESYNVVAEKSGISVHAAEKRAQRAIIKMKKYWKKFKK